MPIFKANCCTYFPFLFFFISLANLLEIKNHKMFKSSNSNILSNVKMNIFQDNLPIKLFITTEYFFYSVDFSRPICSEVENLMVITFTGC